MVEDIVRFHAQTHTARLAQRNFLNEGHVPVVDARAAEAVRPAVPKCPLRGHRERRGIEPLRKGLRPAVRIHTRDAIWTRQDIRTTDISQYGTCHRDGHWLSGRKGIDSREFPVVECAL